MFTLATAPKHKFGDDVYVGADVARGRYQQTEKTCILCKIVKVTAFPPGDEPFRLWRFPGSDEQVLLYDAPACKAAAASS